MWHFSSLLAFAIPVPSAILSDIPAGILSGTLSDIPAGIIPARILSSILCGIFAGIFIGIFSGIFAGSQCGILSDNCRLAFYLTSPFILSGALPNIFAFAPSLFGPIWYSLFRSGKARWHLSVAVQVQQSPVASGAGEGEGEEKDRRRGGDKF